MGPPKATVNYTQLHAFVQSPPLWFGALLGTASPSSATLANEIAAFSTGAETPSCRGRTRLPLL